MKRRLITCMAFLCAIIGTSKGTDYVTGGDGLSISENFIVNRGSSGNVREIWSNNAKMGFNLSQTVELPNGVYTLSMQAMYRASYDAGTSTNCVLYAETTGKVYSTAIANYGDYTPASESLANVAALMTSSADNYANKIPYFIVTDGKANIGARSLGQLTYCNNGYWFIWNPTSLLLSDVTDEVVLGTALEEVKAEAKVILDAAEETDAKTSLQTAYDGATATSEGIVALKEAIRSYYPSLATADNPIDVSSLLINPKYEETAMMVATNNTNTSVAYPMVQPAGWLCSDNLTSGGNFQFYHVVGAGETFDGNSNSDNDGNTLYMRYAWDGLAPEMAAKQTVRLPEGNYRITVPAKKNGANITVNVKYTFAGVTETNTVTTDWTEYSKTFTVNEENRDITVELSFSREKVNVGSQQAYFGGVTLLSYGDPLAATRKLLKEEIEKLKVYKGNTPSGLWDESTGLFAKALVEAEALMTGTPEIAVVEAMIKTLQDYSAQALEMVPVYDALGNLIDLCSVYVAEASSIVSDESVRAAFTEAINAAEDGKDKAENLAAIESLRSGLEAARQTYVMQAEPTNDVTFDMTFNVANAGFASTSGWSGNPLPTLNNGVAEYFNKGFDMSQTLTGLPNGLYEVSCQGFYRMGGYAEAATARTNGSESLNAVLYANDATKPLMSIFECAQENKLYNNDASTSFGWIPDQMNGAAAYFESGYYQSGETGYNKVQVAVTDGKLTIGLKKTELVGNDWTLFDNFKVVKLRSLTAFARALAAAKEVEASSQAAQSAVAEYDGREAELIEAGTVDEATQVLLNSVTIAQNGEKATSLIKNADFTGETVSYPTQNGGGQVIAPAGWTLAYTISEWNDVNVDKDEGDTDVRFNFWAGSITHGELMQTVNALPNGVYCLSANLTTDISDGSSWVAIYGAPLNGEVGRSENVTQSASALTYDNHKVYFKVVDHAATVGVRTDAHYFKIKNVALEYVAPVTTEDAAVLTALDNGRLYQHAFVCRNDAEVDLTGFTNASGASVCLDRKNALIKAASAAQVTNEKNVIVDGVCGQFELTDKEPFALSTAFTAANATYTREMTNTWGTLVLPYAVASDDTHTYYRLTGTRMVDAETSYMSFESVDELPANTPCAFRYKGEGTTVAFTATDAKVAVPEGDKVSGTTDLPGWTSEGYYAQVKMTDAAELAKTYYISNNMFMNATASLTVAPFRATYVDASTSGVNRFLIDFSDDVTGMSDMPSTASLSVFGERGALRLVAGHAVRYSVHTLGGMLVEQGVLQDGGERSLSLPCGIYIVNGLKVQVK